MQLFPSPHRTRPSLVAGAWAAWAAMSFRKIRGRYRTWPFQLIRRDFVWEEVILLAETEGVSVTSMEETTKSERFFISERIWHTWTFRSSWYPAFLVVNTVGDSGFFTWDSFNSLRLPSGGADSSCKRLSRCCSGGEAWRFRGVSFPGCQAVRWIDSPKNKQLWVWEVVCVLFLYGNSKLWSVFKKHLKGCSHLEQLELKNWFHIFEYEAGRN